MSRSSYFKPDTVALHTGYVPESDHGSRAVPVYQTTSYVFESVSVGSSLFNVEQGGHIYSRITNPTVAVLEQRIDLVCEVSVVLGRSQAGDVTCFPLAENSHANGILDVTLVPASISTALSDEAIDAATRIANGLDYCGVLAVEFFISTDDRVLVNEMAPRPHNSGHYSLDACATSQFEQQVRMVCGLAAGQCHLQTPAAMWNVLGDIWPENGEPEWDAIFKFELAKLHLYGKHEARPGRKMGHVNCLGETLDDAKALLAKVRNTLV